MFPGNVEFIAYERHKDLLQEAERMRLINAVQRQQANDRAASRKLTNWIGAQMVQWGLRLQGCSIVPPPQVMSPHLSKTTLGK
jgi:hypothetical protein